MPAHQPERFPELLNDAHLTVDYLYHRGMTPETIRNQLQRLQRASRSLTLSAEDGPVHDAAVAFHSLVKKVSVLYDKLTDSYMATRNRQFDSLKKGLDAIVNALPEDEAKVARLRARVGRVQVRLSEHS